MNEAAATLGPPERLHPISLLSSIAVWGTLRGYGPFVQTTQDESLVLLQAYVFPFSAMVVR